MDGFSPYYTHTSDTVPEDHCVADLCRQAEREAEELRANPTTPTQEEIIEAAIAAEEERIATYPDRLEGAL
jgi:hypothetical protein